MRPLHLQGINDGLGEIHGGGVAPHVRRAHLQGDGRLGTRRGPAESGVPLAPTWAVELWGLAPWNPLCPKMVPVLWGWWSPLPHTSTPKFGLCCCSVAPAPQSCEVPPGQAGKRWTLY